MSIQTDLCLITGGWESVRPAGPRKSIHTSPTHRRGRAPLRAPLVQRASLQQRADEWVGGPHATGDSKRTRQARQCGDRPPAATSAAPWLQPRPPHHVPEPRGSAPRQPTAAPACCQLHMRGPQHGLYVHHHQRECGAYGHSGWVLPVCNRTAAGCCTAKAHRDSGTPTCQQRTAEWHYVCVQSKSHDNV